MGFWQLHFLMYSLSINPDRPNQSMLTVCCPHCSLLLLTILSCSHLSHSGIHIKPQSVTIWDLLNSRKYHSFCVLQQWQWLTVWFVHASPSPVQVKFFIIKICFVLLICSVVHSLGWAQLMRAQAHLNHEPKLSLTAQVGPGSGLGLGHGLSNNPRDWWQQLRKTVSTCK